MRSTMNFKPKLPQRKPKEVDLSYLNRFGPNYKIPTCFEKCNFRTKQSLELRIAGVYDPSKFYIVVKFKEAEVYNSYLFKYYYKYGDLLKVPQNKVRVGMYCVASTDGGFYRGILTACAPSQNHDSIWVKIFYIDYGFSENVRVDKLFYLNEKSYSVPQFAMRASLFGIRPRCDGVMWTVQETEDFFKLVYDKILIGTVIDVDFMRKKFELVLFSDKSETNIQDILVKEGIARYFNDPPDAPKSQMDFIPLVKYPHAFPSHEVLESGTVPDNLHQVAVLLRFLPLDVVFKKYYKAKSTHTKSEL